MEYKSPKMEHELVYVLSDIYQEKEILDNLFRENSLKPVSELNDDNINSRIESLRGTDGKLSIYKTLPFSKLENEIIIIHSLTKQEESASCLK